MNNYLPIKVSIIYFSFTLYLLINSFNKFDACLDNNLKVSLHIQYYYFIGGEIIVYNGLPICKVIDCYWIDNDNNFQRPHFVDIANTFINPDTEGYILEQKYRKYPRVSIHYINDKEFTK